MFVQLSLFTAFLCFITLFCNSTDHLLLYQQKPTQKHKKHTHNMDLQSQYCLFHRPSITVHIFSETQEKLTLFSFGGAALMCLIFCLIIALIFKSLLCANYSFLKAKIIKFNCLLQHRVGGFCCLSSGETEAALTV